MKGKGTQAWRRVPPEPNQSETKLHNRKEYFWCAKCKRWTPSHSTATHRGSKGNETASSTQELAANLVLDPSVWFLSSEPEVSSGFDVAEPFHHQGVDFWFLIGYLALVFYFMPLSNAGRMSSLLGLWQSMKPFGSIVLRYVMSLGYPLLCTSSSYLLRLLELFSSVPLSCYCAPILWLLLYVAINFTASYSKSFKKSKPYVPPPRAGRLNKSSVNRSCRHHRRQVCGSSGKVSLRQRLRIKSREDMRDRMDYFELNSWSKPHWNKNKRRRGRKRSCARQVHAPSKTFSSHQKLKFNHMLRKSFPEFAFVNTPNVTLHSVRANGLATSFCCGGRGHNKSSCGGRARYDHRSGRTGVSSRQHASDSHRFANVTSNFDCLSFFSSSG